MWVDDLVILEVNTKPVLELLLGSVRDTILIEMVLEVLSDEVYIWLLDVARDAECAEALANCLHFCFKLINTICKILILYQIGNIIIRINS